MRSTRHRIRTEPFRRPRPGPELLRRRPRRRSGWAGPSPRTPGAGGGEPAVFFSANTQVMATFWAPLVQAGLIPVLDVGAPPSGPFEAVQAGFQETQAAQLAAYESAAGGGLSPEAAETLILENYHTSVAPFCTVAARAFFTRF